MDTPRTNERRSRFAALSAQVEEFECDLKSDRTLSRKENLLKGPGRRISIGVEVVKNRFLLVNWSKKFF